MDLNRRLEYLRALNRRQLPQDAHCTSCGSDDPIALVRRNRGARCYECGNRNRTGNRYEYHHLMGGHDGPGIWVRGNQHRALSAMQSEWQGRGLPEFARLIFGMVDLGDVRPMNRRVTQVWRQRTVDPNSYAGRWDWYVDGGRDE